MERTKLQQAELDRIEKDILILIFGQEEIPAPTAEIMTALNINPNTYIKKLENKIIPVMKENGDMDGVMLNKLIRLWKPHIADIVNIPAETFRLSDKLFSFISVFFPGF